MPDASYMQPSFLGGEWSIFAQGRMDHPAYKTAMNLCFNGIPIEEGAWARRPGWAFAATTRSGATGRTVRFDFTDLAPFQFELTAGHLRVFNGKSLVFTSDVTTVVAISTETPAVVTLAAPVTWATGAQVQFIFNSANLASDAAILRNRQFAVTMISTTQFSLADPISGAAVNGAQIAFDPTQAQLQLAQVLDLATPYTAPQLQGIRKVQAAGIGPTNINLALLLQGANKPQGLQGVVNPTAPQLSTFTLTPEDFADGPYLDLPVGAIMTPGSLSGNITLTLSYQVWSSTTPYTLGTFAQFGGIVYQSIAEINLNNEPDTSPTFWAVVGVGAAVGGAGFQNSDIGRSIRLLSEPALWAVGTAYITGTAVKFNNAYYTCVTSNTGNEPDTSPADWLPSVSPTVYTWTWGKITAITSPSVIVVNLYGAAANGGTANLLYTQPINSWALGAFSNTTGWPTCGQYYEGRLWLSGVIANRVDGSNSNDPFNFAPTALDGTQGDGNAVAATFDSDDQNTIYWIEPTTQGLICGTKDGEWLIHASQLNDPITPTSIQAHRQTKTGCFNQVPVHTPLTLVFIHKYSRLMFEYFPDVFSGKLTAPNLNTFSKHLTTAGIAEMGYQAELAPIIWARMNDGSLAGWTYRRTSAFANEEPKFVGAHRHALGSGRILESLNVGTDPTQTVDSVTLVTNDPVTGIRHVEMSTPLIDPASSLFASWFVDDGVTPSGLVVNGTASVTLYGLWHLNGKTVSAVIGGLDCGDYLVSLGQITVPFLSDPGKLFTLAYLQSLNGQNFGGFATPLDQVITIQPGQASTPQTIGVLALPQNNVVGAVSTGLRADWANAVAYAVSNSASPGMRQLNMVTFNENFDKTMSQIFGANPAFNLGLPQLPVLGLDGNLYGYCSNSNTGIISKVQASTLSFISRFGTNGSGLTPGTGGFTSPLSLATCVAGANYLVEVGLTSVASCALAVMNTDTMTFFSGSVSSNLTEQQGACCAGPQGPAGGSVFTIGTAGGVPSIAQTHLYETAISPGTVLNLMTPTVTHTVNGVLTALQVDSGWSGGFTQVVGPMYDQADGNIIIGVSTSGSSSPSVNKFYLVKIRPNDASIIWKIAVVNLPDSDGMQNSRVIGGIYCFLANQIIMGGQRTCYVINTLAGTQNNFIITNVQPVGSEYFDSLTGRMVLYCDYAQTAGSPAPAVGTPTSFNNQFAVLTAGSIFNGSSTSNSRITIPAVVGFTYTSQGQLLRPVFPQEAGAANGPALGKTRRNHMVALLLASNIYGTLKLGTTFTDLRGVYPKSTGGKPFDTKTLFSGVYWDTVEDDYSFDGMLCWQITRPLPATISSIQGFINTQDR